jgi:hypothetical protein
MLYQTSSRYHIDKDQITCMGWWMTTQAGDWPVLAADPPARVGPSFLSGPPSYFRGGVAGRCVPRPLYA